MGSRLARSGSPRALVSVLLAALLLSGAATACGQATEGAGGAAAGAPQRGGTYAYPLSLDPGPFDPALGVNSDSAAVLHQVYEGLVRWDEQPDGTLRTAPCLAESWSGNADATVWTFTLRRGVEFQAPVSREVTAGDVVADVSYLSDPAHECPMSYMFQWIEGTDENGFTTGGRLGVTALDRYTVRFTLKAPFSEFPDLLGSGAYWVWPVDHLRAVGVKAYGEHPVGTGPYRFLRRGADRAVDLVANPRWWDTSGGPYLDTIRYVVFSSATSMILAFQKGAVDWTYIPSGQLEASRSLPQVEDGRWRVETDASLGQRYLLFYMKDPVVGGSQGLRIRQALACLCDREAIADASSGGVFLSPTGLVPPGVPGGQKAMDPYGYDVERAKGLLQGIAPIALRLAYPAGQQQQATVRVLRRDFAKAGVTLEATPIDVNHYIGYIAGGKAQAYFSGWLADFPSMDDFLYAGFQSELSPSSLGTCYSSTEVDGLLDKARSTTDPEDRVQRYQQAEQRIFADSPAVPLVVFADAKLLNTRAVNVSFTSMGWADSWKAWVTEL